jgi:hypothetical protein
MPSTNRRSKIRSVNCVPVAVSARSCRVQGKGRRYLRGEAADAQARQPLHAVERDVRAQLVHALHRPRRVRAQQVPQQPHVGLDAWWAACQRDDGAARAEHAPAMSLA